MDWRTVKQILIRRSRYQFVIVVVCFLGALILHELYAESLFPDIVRLGFSDFRSYQAQLNQRANTHLSLLVQVLVLLVHGQLYKHLGGY